MAIKNCTVPMAVDPNHNSLPASIHIVKRYGRCGGMEIYVWELTHALVEQGAQVKVVCDQALESPSSNIEVIEVGPTREKPRWLSMLLFSRRVSQYFAQHPHPEWVIHSHERTGVHQATTFHGPLISQRKKRISDIFSPRLHAWQWLETREVTGKQVKCIFPNSEMIARQLMAQYPNAHDKIAPPAYPGVAERFYNMERPQRDPIIGFMGREWKRKGLDTACAIIKQLLKKHDKLQFLVAGCDPKEIQHLFADLPEQNYQLLGWCNSYDFFEKIDILIHPARQEPFGMVIAEANAAGIFCLISKQCGIASLMDDSNCFCMDQHLQADWVNALDSLLSTSIKRVKPLNLRWSHLAQQHLEHYRTM